MISTDDRLAFIVRFAQMPLSHLRHAELLRLRGELKNFVQQGPGPTHPNKPQDWVIVGDQKPLYLEQWTAKDVQALQQKVREMLDETLRTETTAAGMRIAMTTPRLLPVAYQLWCPARARFLIISGATHDVVLVMLHLLLATGGYDKIRACPATKPRTPGKQCGRIFVRVRKQVYCSAQCEDRARKQRGHSKR